MRVTGPLIRGVCSSDEVRDTMLARLDEMLWDHPVDMTAVRERLTLFIRDRTLFSAWRPDCKYKKLQTDKFVDETWHDRYRGLHVKKLHKGIVPTPDMMRESAEHVATHLVPPPTIPLICLDQPLKWPEFRSRSKHVTWWILCRRLPYRDRIAQRCPTCGSSVNVMQVELEIDFIAVIVGHDDEIDMVSWFAYEHRRRECLPI